MNAFNHAVLRIGCVPVWMCAGLIVLLAWPVPLAQAQPTTKAVEMETLVDSLLALMTLEEKLGQLTQYRGGWDVTGPRVLEGGEEQVRNSQVGSFLSIYGADYTGALQRIAIEESRLGIPLLFAQDVIHGFRTTFPVPLAEASSWDPVAVEQAARIAAVEATSAGVHWTYAPMVDIARDPRWGRVVEGSGEDPYLGSVLAAARVRGFQGTDLTLPNTMLACAKHYVAYGGAEGGRDYNTVDVSERTLREIYLPPFQAAVEAGVASVMGAFNEVGGVPMHANKYLIEDVLRGAWGFDGIFVSDYTGILELIPHGVAATRADAGALALQAGVDVDMVSEIFLKDLPERVRSGAVPEALVDQAVRRVLRAKYQLGLFEDPYRYNNAAREQAVLLADEHIAAAREMARKSMVLLRNEGGLLPLSKGLGTIAVIGPLADARREVLGGWAAAGRAEDAMTILEGIQQAVSPASQVVYARGAEILDPDTSGFGEAVRIAAEADAVILVLGEHHDMSAEALNRASLGLPGVQQELAKAVVATGTPTVVVLMNGRPLSITWVAENVPAVLEAWFLGIQMGPAVADVLFGDYNPGGKLPVSFPRTVGQVPLYYNHKNTGRPPDPNNRYTSKYIDVPWTPLYPFGFGLSYTTFSFEQLEVSPTSLGMTDEITIAVTVRNVGDRTGDEVVQLYIQDEVGSVTRPVKELRGFQRITLEPGTSQTVSFTLSSDDLAFYGLDMKRIVEPGFFTAFVGPNSAEGLEARFELINP